MAGYIHVDDITHYEPRSQTCLNLLSTRELSNKSQNCLYKVSNQFLIWSQTCLKIWDNFETWKGLSYNLVSIADYASRRPSPPGGLVPPSRRTSQVAIVLAPAVVIELQKCCLERDSKPMNSYILHFCFVKTYNYTVIQLCLDFLDARENNTQQESRQDKISDYLGLLVTSLKIYIVVIFFTVWALCGSMWTHCGKLMSQSGNFLHSVGTMWIYVNTLWQINVTEW